MDALTPADRILSLLENTAWQKRRCRHCDALLFLVRVNGGHTVAYTSEGRKNHLTDCPRYRQPPPGSQESLFGETQPEAFEPRR